jgi:Sister chromatid cohesion protein Dcc1
VQLAALEHILLTCIEHGLCLAALCAERLLAVLRAATDDFSCAPDAMLAQLAGTITVRDAADASADESACATLLPHAPAVGPPVVRACRQQLVAAGASVMWHVLRRFAVSPDGRIPHATRPTPQAAPHASTPSAGTELAFDRTEVSRGCMQAVLSRLCETNGGSAADGQTRVSLDVAAADWEDTFPALHHWDGACEGSAQAGASQRQELMLAGCSGVAVMLPRAQVGCQEVAVLFEELLPLRASERFEVLFRVMDVWTREQLEPYLRIADAEGCSATELILRHTRSIRTGGDGPVQYVAR